MNNGSAIPTELAREIARQGEVRLNAIMTIATAADARASTLCGVFGAASAALVAAVLAYLGTEHYVMRLVWSGSLTASLLFLSALIAAFAGAPRDFWLAGGDPKHLRDWSWDGNNWCSEGDMLDASALRLADMIDKDRRLLERQSKRVILSLWVAGLAVPLGAGLFFVLSCAIPIS